MPNLSPSESFYVETTDRAVQLYDTQSNQKIAEGKTGFDQYSHRGFHSFTTHQAYFSNDENFIFLHMTKLSGVTSASTEPRENWIMTFKIILTHEKSTLEKIGSTPLSKENLAALKNQLFTYDENKKILFEVTSNVETLTPSILQPPKI